MDRYQLHIDKALTNLSVQYRNAEFIADQIFPEVPVQDQSDKYFVFGKDNLRRVDDRMTARVTTNEIQMSRSPQGYDCTGHGVKFAIADEWRGNDDLGSLEIDATNFTTEAVMLNREINMLNVMVAGMSITDLSASRGAQQFDNASFDPVTFIDQQKEVIGQQIGKRANTLMLSRASFRGFRNNPNVKGRISGAPTLDASRITVAQLAAVLEVDEILIGDATVNTAKEGEADNLSYVWGHYSSLFYKTKTPGLRTVSLGYHFMWNFPISGGGRVSAQTGQAGIGVRQWREEGPRLTMVESSRYYDQNIVAPTAGILYSNCVSS